MNVSSSWEKVSEWLQGAITKDRARQKGGSSHLSPKLLGSHTGESWVESMELSIRIVSEPFMAQMLGGRQRKVGGLREWRLYLFWEVGQWRASDPGCLWLGEGTMIIMLWKSLENVGRSGTERSWSTLSKRIKAGHSLSSSRETSCGFGGLAFWRRTGKLLRWVWGGGGCGWITWERQSKWIWRWGGGHSWLLRGREGV